MVDQMKASILSLYSEIGIECPEIERLAKEGVIFENAITPSPLCVPARTSIMTGKYPHSTGCRRNETLLPKNQNHAFKISVESDTYNLDGMLVLMFNYIDN